MDNTSLQNLLKRLCKVMWEANVTNPITYVTQISYILFLKMLEEMDAEQADDPKNGGTRKPIFTKVKINGDTVDFGNLEWHSLENTKAIIYSRGNLPPLQSQQDEIEVLNVFLHHVGGILNSLWLVKDNAVNFELGFMQLKSLNGTRFHSNFLSAAVTTAAGQSPATRFTRHELRTASRLFQEFLSDLSNSNILLRTEIVKGVNAPKLSSQRTVSRLTRATYFLSGARLMPDLGSKIVDYITALEVLFSTDSSELSHKVAHRVAVFLGASAEEKQIIFAAVKKAYNVRSKVVHGDVLSKETVEQIADISQQIDEVLRKVLLKIFAAADLKALFDGKKENLEAYFLKSSFL